MLTISVVEGHVNSFRHEKHGPFGPEKRRWRLPKAASHAQNPLWEGGLGCEQGNPTPQPHPLSPVYFVSKLSNRV